MRFPGKRSSKHYFPVDERDPLLLAQRLTRPVNDTHIVGIDQTLVDIEARVERELLERYHLGRGHSLVVDDATAEALYDEIKSRGLVTHEFAGGTIGNTLHNYSVLADDASILLGVMSQNIRIGSYAYKYLCHTSSRMVLDHLQPVDGPIGRCLALIDADGERTFAISEGQMNQLRPESIPEQVVRSAAALVLTAYLLRGKDGDPMPAATMRAVEIARDANVPVVLTLGTRHIVAERPDFWRRFISEHVAVLAMNEGEAAALTGISDPLRASDVALDWADLVLCTAGPVGLYMAGYTDDAAKRETRRPLLPGELPEFNRWEYSRPMIRSRCHRPIRVYSHIAPFMGGPERIRNTNGAGDGALSALLHDMAANRYHRANVPGSAKHSREFLAYSSFSQICKYANRVAYEVLMQHSPRLTRGLPERVDSTEIAYWVR
jgi:inosine kinase